MVYTASCRTMNFEGLVLAGIFLATQHGAAFGQHRYSEAAQPSHNTPFSPDASLVRLKDLARKFDVFIGTASNAQYIRRDKEYVRILNEQFSLVTPENACKWTAIRPNEETFDFTDCDFVLAMAEANQQTVRGHNLCWGIHNPDWLAKYDKNSSALRSLLVDHITRVGKRYAGRVYSWDFVNEAVLKPTENGTYLKTNVWYPAIPDIIDLAFKTIHSIDRSAKLFYNDYGYEVINSKSDAIHRMVKTMLLNNVPVHGIGMEAHFFIHNDDGSHTEERLIDGDHKLGSPVPADWSSVEDNFRRFIDLGLEIHITEMDVSIPSITKYFLEKQADVYRNLLKICLKFAPMCKSFETWEFVDKYSWRTGEPDYFDDNYKPKPCFFAVADTLNTTVPVTNG